MKSYLVAQTRRLINRTSRQMPLLGSWGHSPDVIDMALFRAGWEAAEFYEEKLVHAAAFSEHSQLIAHAVKIAEPSGLFLEFGVATGRTITEIATGHAGPVFGFDSFEGLPEHWYEGYGKGAFARTDLPPVPANVTLLKGWFTDSLPGFLERTEGPVSFLHVDCDLYSSSSFVLQSLADRIKPGCVILFDEYFNYPGWRVHEFKAFEEFIAATSLKFRYEAFLRTGQAVCVVIE